MKPPFKRCTNDVKVHIFLFNDYLTVHYRLVLLKTLFKILSLKSGGSDGVLEYIRRRASRMSESLIVLFIDFLFLRFVVIDVSCLFVFYL